MRSRLPSGGAIVAAALIALTGGFSARAVRYHAAAVELWPDARFKGFMALSPQAVSGMRDRLAKAGPGR